MKPLQKATLVALCCTAAILLIGVPVNTLPGRSPLFVWL